MDNTSKKILKLLKETPDFEIFYYDEPYLKLNISEDEFFRAVEYLDRCGYTQCIRNQNGVPLGTALTHEAVHSKSIKFDSFKHWLFSTFFGGVIIGVCSTLLSEAVLFACAVLLG